MSLPVSSASPSILTTGQIHSEAYNFLSSIQAGVDPRTGAFTASVTLPPVAANDLRGPLVSLDLNYSPLSAGNQGFGKGWRLVTSSWDSASQHIQLASGERYRTQFSGNTLIFPDVPLPAVTAIVEGGVIWLRYRDGVTERLEPLPGDSGAWVVTHIAALDGSAVTLRWTAVGAVARLLDIVDAQDRRLLAVQYDSEVFTQVTAMPGTDAEVVMTFMQVNGELRRVCVDELATDCWQFTYDSTLHPGLMLLTSCVQPTGFREEVQYDVQNGLRLPEGAPLATMPVVSRSAKITAPDEPILYTTYRFDLHGTTNYFGWPVVERWQDYADNLYHHTDEHEFIYGSVETQLDAQNNLLGEVSRSFNRFHLLIRERRVQGSAQVDTVTHYYARPDLAVGQQVPYFLFPRLVITSKAYLDERKQPIQAITTTEETRYDDEGNTVWHRDAIGTVTTTEYYPGNGEGDNCPADPLGRVMRAKMQTTTPPPGTEGPIKQTRYQYRELPARHDAPDFVLPRFITRTAEIIYQVEGDTLTERVRTTDQHIDAPTSPYHGRLLSSTRLKDGRQTVTAYAYDTTTAHSADGTEIPVLQTIATLTGGDGTWITTCNTQSLHTGQTVTHQGDNGVVVASAYDTLGRLTRESVAPTSLYEASVKWDYSCSIANSCRIRTSSTGRVRRLWYDTMGRELREEAQDDRGGFYTTRSIEYDLLGQKVSETTCDPGNPELAALVLTTTMTYDDWGEVLTTTGPDGVVNHTVNNPVSLTGTSWVTGTNGQDGMRTVTTYSLAGDVLEERLFDGNGQLHRRLTWSYDGLGRCVSKVDAMGGETRQAWDVFDRLVLTHLPDGTQVHRTYAPGHEDLVATIAVSHPSLEGGAVVLGERRYDDIGRLLSERTGQRTTRWTYQPGNLDPVTTILPNGTEVTTERIPELSNALASMQAGDIWVRNEYDRVRGLLTKSEGNLGHSTHAWSFYDAPQRSDYVWTGDKERSQAQCNTPGQRTSSRIDADGSHTFFSFDEYGRPSEQRDPDATVTLAYDAFSRIQRQRTTATDGSREIDVNLTYDALGQTVSQETRTRTGSQTVHQTEALTWRQDGKLLSRIRSVDGTPVLTETFDYDERGRTVLHRAAGTQLPQDAHGHRYVEQRFQYDALDNIRRLDTVLAEGGLTNITLFEFGTDEPTQLVRVTHSDPSYPAPLALSYDALGNLSSDEQKRPLRYDALGRLTAVTLHDGSECLWQYGPGGNVVMTHDQVGPRWRYSVGDVVSCELASDVETRWVYAGAIPVAESRLAASIRSVTLLGTDGQGSVTTELDGSLRLLEYSAYGSAPQHEHHTRLGYTGALREPGVGWYLLGDYRVYNPALMRFHSHDNLSPFDEGGLNGYVYCSSDPINRVDPSGHAWYDWILPATGLVLGIVSFGTAVIPFMAATAAIYAGTAAVTASYVALAGSAALATTSLGTGLASTFLQADGNSKAARILGIVSTVTAVLSGGMKSVSGRLAPAAKATPGQVARRATPPTHSVVKESAAPKIFRTPPPGSNVANPGVYPNNAFTIPAHQLQYNHLMAIHRGVPGTFDNIRAISAANPLPLPSAPPVPASYVTFANTGNTPVQFYRADPRYVEELLRIGANKHPIYTPARLNALGNPRDHLLSTTQEVRDKVFSRVFPQSVSPDQALAMRRDIQVYTKILRAEEAAVR